MGVIPGISARPGGVIPAPALRTTASSLSSKLGSLSGTRLRTQTSRRVAVRGSTVVEAVYSNWGSKNSVGAVVPETETVNLKLVYEYDVAKSFLPPQFLVPIEAQLWLVGKDGMELPTPVEFTAEPTADPDQQLDPLQEQEKPNIEVPKGFEPAAIMVQSKGPHGAAFRLVAVTFTAGSCEALEVPCFSWIEAASPGSDPVKYCFFCSEPCLPKDTPQGLVDLRYTELMGYRGELGGAGEKRKRPDRIYEFDVYNDLIQDTSGSVVRPILGGWNGKAKRPPYPRRYRTGRNLFGEGWEEPVPEGSLNYVPKDADMKTRKKFNFMQKSVEAARISQKGVDAMQKRVASGDPPTFKDHDDFEHIMYEDEESKIKFPKPFVYSTREDLWREKKKFADFEFGRQRIAGVNPCTIKAVTDISQVAPVGDDTISKKFLNSESLSSRISEKRVFIVDYRDEMLVDDGKDYVLNKLNKDSGKFVYAPGCVLYLTDKGHLKPVAIVLAAPSGQGKNSSVYSLVYSRSDSPTEWEMAKAHFLAVDSAVHQLYSHFTRCHANSEVYVVSMWRNLSSLHPIFRLLAPHFKDTLRINANARQGLISTKGPVERHYIGGELSMSLASVLYAKHFRFKTESLPEDLKKRGMATVSDNGDLKLTLEDYPYAQDGLLLWNAIEKWVTTYVNHYYVEDEDVLNDQELRRWWIEVTDVGHPDIVDQGYATYEEMWPVLNSRKDLVGILATIIWIASGHHAAINFGQFNYTGYMPTVPSMCTSRMPEKGRHSGEVEDDEAIMAFLAPIAQTVGVASLMHVLSTHYADEEYLGEEIEHWFQDETIQGAREAFEKDLIAAQDEIKERNTTQDLPSRNHEMSIPYYLLSPYKVEFAGDDPNKKPSSGVPNSVSV